MRINQLKNKLHFENISLQTISMLGKLCTASISVLRLDQIHSDISGNKWFKLQYFLEAFLCSGKSKLATFGGAYSNHIAATATACKILQIPCIGFIRGEVPKIISPTLRLAKDSGMELYFINRESYRDKKKWMDNHKDYYWVPEGGYGQLGMKGAKDIWQYVPNSASYDEVYLPVGSGTTISGMVSGAEPHQKIFGMSVLKNDFSLQEEIAELVPSEYTHRLTLIHDYHFGGYAKKAPELLTFMNQVWMDHAIPLDFVYTAKAFYGLWDRLNKGLIAPESNVLFIHTGGLQGNQSLPDKSLLF